MQWTIIQSPPADAKTNMAIDSALFLNHRSDTPPIFRIYSWKSPSISIGRLMPMEIVDLDACYRDGIDVVRRPTGGGAVYHNRDLSFSIIYSRNNNFFPQNLRESYCFIHRRIVLALQGLGIPATLYQQIADSRYQISDKNRLTSNIRYQLSDTRHLASGIWHPYLCFLHPVEGDVMVGRIKVAGGAQCRNRTNWLYQGTLDLNPLAENYLRYFNRVGPA